MAYDGLSDRCNKPVYSSAEIFTWKTWGSKSVLVLYGGSGETHKLAITTTQNTSLQLEGPAINTSFQNGSIVLNWDTASIHWIVQIGDFFIYILDCNSAYDFWVMDCNTTSLIIDAGYLIRSAVIHEDCLYIEGDPDATVALNILNPPAKLMSLSFNGEKLMFSENTVTGEWSSILDNTEPTIHMPDLAALEWKYIDNLPEIQPDYNDSLWTPADHTTTNNTRRTLLTPTCLFASDYGYNSGGMLIFRGKFTSTGNETSLLLWTQGGSAYSTSVWLTGVSTSRNTSISYLGSNDGTLDIEQLNSTYYFSTVQGQEYIFTTLIQNKGFEMNTDPAV